MPDMKILYMPKTEGISDYGYNNAAADADIVIGAGGRILKARFGHRKAAETIAQIAKEVAR